jgi:MYXO-CTERM domain-containing protein
MKRTLMVAAAIVVLTGTPAFAHRLDEYLQGTLISVERNRIDAQITLTPGVAVFPALLAEIDIDGNGVISATEQQAYEDRILRDLSFKIDGRPLTSRLLSAQFPAVDEMKEGRGEIRIELAAELSADLVAGGPRRKLTFENRHQSRIAAYQVNCLVPRDRDIRILAQNRNYSQSFYELEFAQPDAQKPPGTAALLLVAGVALLWRRRQIRSKAGHKAG